MVNNNTYAALSIKNGDDYASKFTENDWFKVVITGFDGKGDITGEKEFYLADFRDGKSYICDKWTSVNLESLGKVNKLEFTFDSTDKGQLGINTPQYVCIDDIVYYID
jgi:hypothetical protein